MPLTAGAWPRGTACLVGKGQNLEACAILRKVLRVQAADGRTEKRTRPACLFAVEGHRPSPQSISARQLASPLDASLPRPCRWHPVPHGRQPSEIVSDSLSNLHRHRASTGSVWTPPKVSRCLTCNMRHATHNMQRRPWNHGACIRLDEVQKFRTELAASKGDLKGAPHCMRAAQ